MCHFFFSLHHDDNGTFLCNADNEYGLGVAIIENFVLDKPQVSIDYVRAVDKDKLFFNWTITDWNSDILDYFLSVSLNQLISQEGKDEINFFLLTAVPTQQ